MDRIQSPTSYVVSSAPKYIQYKDHTFLDVSDQITKQEGPIDMDHMSAYNPSKADRQQFWRPYFSSAAMRSSSAISNVYQDIDAEINETVDCFLDGGMTERELSETFKSMLTRLSDACNESGYPIPLGLSVDGEQAMADCFFSDFRQRILDKAVSRNNQEGLQYATNGKDGHWQYYNSDYYYKSESAISAIKDGVMDYCHEKGYSDFTLTDSKNMWKLQLVDYNYCDDFNSAWSHSVNIFGHKTLLDSEQAPPKDFVWFYETGGTGEIYAYENKAPNSSAFDPDDPRSARMWMSYKNADGKLQRISKAFQFDGSKADLKTVASLLPVVGGNYLLDKFLQNLQVFSGGYFRKYPGTSVDFKA